MGAMLLLPVLGARKDRGIKSDGQRDAHADDCGVVRALFGLARP